MLRLWVMLAMLLLQIEKQENDWVEAQVRMENEKK
jgi:hypothetical protein